MATITGDHVGYPGLQDLGNFSPRRKNFGGSKNLHFFWRRISPRVSPSSHLFTVVMSQGFMKNLYNQGK
jgi:hypothetical protein